MSESEEYESNKRRRLEEREQSFPVTDLPDVLLKACFSFVGSGNYYFVAATCKRFEQVYPYRKRTTWKIAAASVSCVQTCVDDNAVTRALRNEIVLVELRRGAASTRCVSALEWIRLNGGPLGAKVDSNLACDGGHLAVFEWAKGKGLEWYSEGLSMTAARNGHLNMLKFMHRYHTLSNDCQGCAAEGGHVQVLEWMKSRGLLRQEYDRWSWEKAAEFGHFHVLEWFLECNGVDVLSAAAHGAAQAGRIDVLLWAQQKGVVLSACQGCCKNAALGGQLDTLKWLRENGFPWDGFTIHYAATDEIAQWARDNGCPEPRGHEIYYF